MSDNEFDELFRSRLRDHRSAVPGEMWQRIRGGSQDRRGFRLWRWYFVGPMVLVAALVFGPGVWREADVTLARQDRAPSKLAHAGRDGGSSNVVLIPKAYSVSEPAIIRSGAVPRLHSGPGFFASGKVGGAQTAIASGIAQDGAAGSESPYHWQALPAPVAISFPSPQALRPKSNPIPCPEIEHLKVYGGWFVEGYFSPDFLSSSRPQGFSYSAGARVGREFPDLFSATIGFQFSHKSWRAGEDSLAVPPFNNIDVPVLLGYRFRIGTGYLYTIHAGVIWNLHSQPAGPDYGVSYQNSTGMALYLAIGCMAKLSSRWGVFVEPHFQYQLTNRRANLLQSPDLGGVSLGMRYNFFRAISRIR